MQLSGDTDEGDSEYLIANITMHNITQMMFNLTWDDDKPFLGMQPNDEFIMNITSPNEETYEGGPSTEEQIMVYAPESGYMNQLPEEDDMEAESPEILEMELAKNHTSSEGIGDWAINITLTEAGGVVSPGAALAVARSE